MDLKLKSITWVGNMYQKFEAACHDVDEIVNQDTVRYVESRVQTVGEGMKKFYSGLVQDMLPPMGHVKHVAQSVALKQNVAYAPSTESAIEIKDNPVDTDHRKSSVDPYVINSLNEKLCGASCLSMLHRQNELICAQSIDPIEGLDSSHSSFMQNDDVPVEENADVSVEEHVTENQQSSSDVQELFSPQKEDSSEASSVSGSSNKNCEKACGILPTASPANSIYDTEFKFYLPEGLSCDKLLHRKGCTSDVSCGIQYSESSFYAASCEKRTAEVMSSSTSLVTKSLPSIEVLSYKIGENDVSGHNSNTYQPHQFSQAASGGDQVTETGLASSCSIMSNDLDSFCINKAVSSAEYSDIVQEPSRESYQMGAFTSSFELGKSVDFNDITDSNMEAIDLCDEVELGDGCVIVDNSVPYGLSCRAPKLRSYKKKIQEAFASRKRLVKEYELLPILYGDMDLVYSQSTGQNMLSASTASSDLKKLPMHNSIDCGWELV